MEMANDEAHLQQGGLVRLDVLREVLEALLPLRFPYIQLVYLFGSQADGTANTASDVDLGVLFEFSATRRNDRDVLRADLAYALGQALKRADLDLVWLEAAPVELAFEVIRQGVCVYATSEDERIEFEARTMSRFADYAPVLKSLRAQILEEGEYEERASRYRTAFGRTERTLREIRSFKKPAA